MGLMGCEASVRTWSPLILWMCLDCLSGYSPLDHGHKGVRLQCPLLYEFTGVGMLANLDFMTSSGWELAQRILLPDIYNFP